MNQPSTMSRSLSISLADYSMVGVLLFLCTFFTFATWKAQRPRGAVGASVLAARITAIAPKPASVIIVAAGNETDQAFAQTLETKLKQSDFNVIGSASGEPSDARNYLDNAIATNKTPALIACSEIAYRWNIYQRLAEKYPKFKETLVIQPEATRGSQFLRRDNLLNIANQIAVIAIIAIGMTMVIITAGIDLSVGSLVALSAVVTTMLIRDQAGGLNATVGGMTACCLVAIALCGLVGAMSGFVSTQFQIPPFIVTLAMMLVGSGTAYLLSEGQSIDQVPDQFVWLGRGADLARIPNAVVLMVVLYTLAHLLMTRTTLGRYIYAAGGNAEAARLSGVPVKKVLILVYTIGGLLAGLGGVIMASQLKSGSPSYGQMYELYVIAAVVVGGTSLSGGDGNVCGTLIGAFIIAVIQNGMNLTGVESFTQKIVLGLVILAAVLFDRLKSRR